MRLLRGSGRSRISIWLGQSGPCQSLGRHQDPLPGTFLVACLGTGGERGCYRAELILSWMNRSPVQPESNKSAHQPSPTLYTGYAR